MEKESLLLKIKALLNKAESAKELGSFAEYETFMAKVQEMLIKHNLEMSQVKETKEKDEIDESGMVHSFGEDKTEGIWDLRLVESFGYFYFCDVIYNSYRRKFNLIGTKENVEICTYLFETTRKKLRDYAREEYGKKLALYRNTFSIWATDGNFLEVMHKAVTLSCFSPEWARFIKALNDHFGDEPILDKGKQIFVIDYSTPKVEENGTRRFVLNESFMSKASIMPSRGTFIRSFLGGATAGIYRKLYREREHIIKQQTPEAGAQINALVKLNRADLEAYRAEKHKNVKNLKGEQLPSTDIEAYQKGVKTGQGMSFNVGLNSSTAAPTRLLK